MVFEYEHEDRRVRLPREVWLEINSRATRKGISPSDVITEALQAYFDLTGHISEYADGQVESASGGRVNINVVSGRREYIGWAHIEAERYLSNAPWK
jgi:hypothetical protein